MTRSPNARRWDDATRGVYEVWYLTWNHPETDQGFWLRYIAEAPHDGPSRGELWFARFDPARPERTFGIHRRFAHVIAGEPFRVEIASARLGDDHAIGELAGDGHRVSWELRWQPAGRPLELLPHVMYGGGGRGETTVISPNPRVAVTGRVIVDGEPLAFERAVLGQTHLWGRKHAYSWTWGRCADFAGAPDGLLELLGVRLQRRGVTLPPLTMVALDLEGEQHRLNQFRHVLGNRGRWDTGRVGFTAWSPTIKLEGELTCAPSDMVSAPYLDPDGTRVFCANTEIGDARVIVYKRSRLVWREHRRLTARRRAHFEIGQRARDPAVVREHTLVE
jgi:hypothetical protein